MFKLLSLYECFGLQFAHRIPLSAPSSSVLKHRTRFLLDTFIQPYNAAHGKCAFWSVALAHDESPWVELYVNDNSLSYLHIHVVNP